MKTFGSFLAAILVLVAAAGALVFSGRYNIGADVPHWPVVLNALQTVRARSIAAHARDIAVPDLAEAERVRAGAAHYSEMCTGCHLAPGMADSEIRQGLYPVPPKLAEPGARDPAQEFWAIKHGIKSTAMPAWGATHDDEAIWSLVAFLQKLPELSPDAYAAMTSAEPTHTHADGHEHVHHHHDEEARPTDPDAGGPDVITTVNAFDQALAVGDEAKAKALLAPDVLIYESGGQEASRDEYAAHHLPDDIAFMEHMHRKIIDRRQRLSGELAWVATRSRITGKYENKPLDLLSTETLVLQRLPEGWRIVHIQWSSRPAAPAKP